MFSLPGHSFLPGLSHKGKTRTRISLSSSSHQFLVGCWERESWVSLSLLKETKRLSTCPFPRLIILGQVLNSLSNSLRHVSRIERESWVTFRERLFPEEMTQVLVLTPGRDISSRSRDQERESVAQDRPKRLVFWSRARANLSLVSLTHSLFLYGESKRPGLGFTAQKIRNKP